jgi:hypothetical protein
VTIEAHPQFVAAFMQASDEAGLADYFRPLVLPLFNMPFTQWPGCCAGNCLPCAQTLVAVALKTYSLLGLEPREA